MGINVDAWNAFRNTMLDAAEIIVCHKIQRDVSAFGIPNAETFSSLV